MTTKKLVHSGVGSFFGLSVVGSARAHLANFIRGAWSTQTVNRVFNSYNASDHLGLPIANRTLFVLRGDL